MGLNMKRSAFRGQSGHTAFFLKDFCVLFPFLVSAKVSRICIFCAVKLKGLAHADLAEREKEKKKEF